MPVETPNRRRTIATSIAAWQDRNTSIRLKALFQIGKDSDDSKRNYDIAIHIAVDSVGGRRFDGSPVSAELNWLGYILGIRISYMSTTISRRLAATFVWIALFRKRG